MLHIFVLKNEQDPVVAAQLVCSDILAQDLHVCGFDTETTVPNARTNQSYSIITSIVQVCFRGRLSLQLEKTLSAPMKIPLDNEGPSIPEEDYTCIILPFSFYQQTQRKLPQEVIRMLKSQSLVKVGAAIGNDAKSIGKSYGVPVNSWIDLQDIARSLGLKKQSLNDLALHYLGSQKEESQLGNYDGRLTPSQIRYAAMDAYLSLAVYEEMLMGRSRVSAQGKEVAPPLSLSRMECENILDYLRNKSSLFLSKKAFPSTKVVSVLYNGFNGWKKIYSEKEVIHLTDLFLRWAAEREVLIHNPSIELYSLPDSGLENDPMKERAIAICHKTITAAGIAHASLIRVLENSMPKDFPVDPQERQSLFAEIVGKIAKDGVIVRAGPTGRYFLPRS